MADRLPVLPGHLDAVTQTILADCIVFFFASAAASAGYLTVSEILPDGDGAVAMAMFYAIATALGGISDPSSLASSSAAERHHEPCSSRTSLVRDS